LFRDFLQKYFLNNYHRVTVQLIPDDTLESQQSTEEKKKLSTIKASLNDEDLQDIINSTKNLKQLQSSEDSLEDRQTIPKLALSDMKREVTEYPCAVNYNHNDSGVTIIKHELPLTSGIVYVHFVIDITNVPLKDVSLLPLFTRILTEVGTSNYSDVELSRYIGTHTGGVSALVNVQSVRPDGVEEGVIHSGDHLITKMFITGKSTSSKSKELFHIIHTILTDANLNSQSKVLEMLRESKQRLETAVQESGHHYSTLRTRSKYSYISSLEEIMGGFTYLNTLTNLIREAEENWSAILSRLENIRNIVLKENICRNGMILDITGDASVMKDISPSVDNFLTELPGNPKATVTFPDPYSTIHPWVLAFKSRMPLRNEGFIVPTQVSYVTKGGRLFQEGEYISGSSSVISRFLSTNYLWDRVRVIGGAYGAFCNLENNGIFTCSSYRDPNLKETLTVYDEMAQNLNSTAILLESDFDTLSSAIIGTIGDLDSVLSPDMKGRVAFNRWLARESPEYRQKYRDEVLNSKPSDFLLMAKKLSAMKDKTVAVVSSKGKFESAREQGLSLDIQTVS